VRVLGDQRCGFVYSIHQDDLEYTLIGNTNTVCITRLASEWCWWGGGDKTTHHSGTRRRGFHVTRVLYVFLGPDAGAQRWTCHWGRLVVWGRVTDCLTGVGCPPRYRE